jgi:hypothetical protein
MYAIFGAEENFSSNTTDKQDENEVEGHKVMYTISHPPRT